MNARNSKQTEQVAGGRRAASSEPCHPSAGLLLRLCLSKRPHPHPPGSAAKTIGRPQKGLLFARLSAHSAQHHTKVENRVSEPRRDPSRSL